MDLSDLRKGIHELSDTELIETLRNIRTNRRARTPAPTSKKQAKPKEVSLNIDTMSQASILELLTQLEGR